MPRSAMPRTSANGGSAGAARKSSTTVKFSLSVGNSSTASSEPRVVHDQRRFAVTLLLLPVLNLGLHDVAARHLAERAPAAA